MQRIKATDITLRIGKGEKVLFHAKDAYRLTEILNMWNRYYLADIIYSYLEAGEQGDPCLDDYTRILHGAGEVSLPDPLIVPLVADFPGDDENALLITTVEFMSLCKISLSITLQRSRSVNSGSELKVLGLELIPGEATGNLDYNFWTSKTSQATIAASAWRSFLPEVDATKAKQYLPNDVVHLAPRIMIRNAKPVGVVFDGSPAVNSLLNDATPLQIAKFLFLYLENDLDELVASIESDKKDSLDVVIEGELVIIRASIDATGAKISIIDFAAACDLLQLVDAYRDILKLEGVTSFLGMSLDVNELGEYTTINPWTNELKTHLDGFED